MPSHSPAGWVRNVVKRIVNVPAKATSAHAQASQPTEVTGSSSRGRSRRVQEPGEEERPGHEDRDERRLLRRERERQQRADHRGLMDARAVEEAEHHGEQPQRDARDVDVLAREAAEVQVGRPDGEQGRRGERGEAAEEGAQQPADRDHAGAHERRREARREVRVAEQHVHERRQVEAQRPVQDRHVDVVAPVAEDPGEVGVLALVVVEGAVAQRVQPQSQGERHERDPRHDLPAARFHARASLRIARSRARPP